MCNMRTYIRHKRLASPHPLAKTIISQYVFLYTLCCSHRYKHGRYPVADPGFPVGGGVDLVGGVWTPEAVTFRNFCMSKRKNWDP